MGDLIEGYDEDPEILNAQWQEIETSVGQPDMPFLNVAGNHDISNESMRDIWVRTVLVELTISHGLH